MHELKGANKPAASEHPATEVPHQRTAYYAETRNRLKRAAEQVTSALLPDKLARLDRNDTVGALFKGLFSLRQARLLTPALVDPLLVVLASAVANIPNWPTNHAIDIAKGLNTLFSDKVFEWHALQPAFHALMGRPAHGESWSASDVAAFVRGSKVENLRGMVAADKGIETLQGMVAAIERRNENKALEWLAKSDNENLAGYRAISSDSILSLAIFSSMPKLALAILGTSVGRRCAAEPNKLGVTPLHLAVRLGNMVLLEALLRIEEVVRNINYKGNDGYDAVGAALVLGRTEVLKRLMQLDAVREQPPQAGYNKGNSALSMALAHDRMDALKVLLSHPELARQAATEQSIEIPAGHGYGPVTLAQYFAHLGNLTTLSVLTAVDRVLEHEAAIVKPFNLAGLALHSGSRAVFNHVLACPQLQPLAGLLTVSGCTPLMLAVWGNNDELFAKLLAISAVRATVLSAPGARLRIMTQWPPSLPPQTLPYKDVLDLAVQGGNHGMASSLLQVQEVLDAVDKRGDYAQGLLLRCMDHRMPDLVLALLQRPLVAKVVRIPDSSGMTALHHAAKLGQTRIVETLLRMLPASEIARSNREDKSAFLIAKEAGHQETARVLAAAMAAADANAALNQ